MGLVAMGAAALAAGPAWGASALVPEAMGILYVERQVVRTYSETYHQQEAYAVWPLGSGRPLMRGWRGRLALEATCGRIADLGSHAFTGSLGPRFSLAPRGGRVVLHAGLRPTYISNFRLASVTVGTHFQFTSHVGVLVRLFGGLAAGWRLAHMSNAGMRLPNPGITVSTLDLELAW